MRATGAAEPLRWDTGEPDLEGCRFAPFCRSCRLVTLGAACMCDPPTECCLLGWALGPERAPVAWSCSTVVAHMVWT